MSLMLCLKEWLHSFWNYQNKITDINNIHWCGGDSWVIQLGDQIDRCRPDTWADNNCIENFNDVIDIELLWMANQYRQSAFDYILSVSIYIV